MQNIGLLLIAQAILDFANTPIVSLLASHGHKIIVHLDTITFAQVTTGLVILCIGWIFTQAHALHETQTLTI